MKNLQLFDGSDDEAIPEVLSDTLEYEVSRFVCLSTYLTDDEALYARFLTELSGDGRHIIRRLHERLTKVLERDETEH